MSRFISDILILVGIVLGVRVIAEGQFDVMGLLDMVSTVTNLRLPFEIHNPSLALGMVCGAIIYATLSVRWSDVPGRTASWLTDNSSRFSYVGLSLVFAVVLLYF